MKRPVVIILILAAIAGAWAVLLVPSARQRPERAVGLANAPELAAEGAPEAAPDTNAPQAVPPSADMAEQAPPPDEPSAEPSEEPSLVPGAEELHARSGLQPPEPMGPIDELKAAYQSDPRDTDAGDAERRIRAIFAEEGVPKELLRQVSCVKGVCKIETRWSVEGAEGYMIAMMGLVTKFGQQLAIEPAGGDDGRQHPIDVYVSRLEPPYAPEVQ